MSEHPARDQIRGTLGQELRDAYRDTDWRAVAKVVLIFGAVVVGIGGMAWQGARFVARRRSRKQSS